MSNGQFHAYTHSFYQGHLLLTHSSNQQGSIIGTPHSIAALYLVDNDEPTCLARRYAVTFL